MRKFFYKMKNIPWVNVLIIALVSVLCIGSIVAIGSYVKNDKTTLSSLEFKRGALNDLGFYVESDKSIYTKDLIECQGLEIEPDFEVIGNYRVYYYDAEKRFMGSTTLFSAQEDGVYVKGDDFPYAKYCRIVITPTPEVDEDGHVDEDFKINFYEVAGYANKYKISVNKDQKKVDIEDFFLTGTHYLDKDVDSSNNTFVLKDGTYNLIEVDVSNLNSLNIVYNTGVSSDFSYYFIDANNNIIKRLELPRGEESVIINIVDNCSKFVLIYSDVQDFSIYRAS